MTTNEIMKGSMMKRLIAFSFLALLSLPALADDAAPKIQASLTNVDHQIHGITLDEHGEVAVTYWENNCLARQQLSPATSMRLNYLATSLADAETVTDRRNRTCLVRL